MIYPLVRELAVDGVAVTVTCRVLKIARQPYYRWLSDPVTSSPWRSNASSSTGIATARYFPHAPPLTAHTRVSTFTASGECFTARIRVRGDTARGPGLAATAKRLRALSLDQPVTATTSSSNTPLSFFDARAYALAYFAVISTLALIDSLLPMPRMMPAVRGHS